MPSNYRTFRMDIDLTGAEGVGATLEDWPVTFRITWERDGDGWSVDTCRFYEARVGAMSVNKFTAPYFFSAEQVEALEAKAKEKANEAPE